MTGSRRLRRLALLASGRWLALCVFIASAAQPSGAGERSTEPPDPPDIAAIRFYQRYLSSLKHGRCRFQPSCSQYAVESIGAHGLFEGTARALDRLVRCNRSAVRFHPPASDGRLSDPVGSEAFGPAVPRVPHWLLPGLDSAVPAGVVAAQPSHRGRDERAARAADDLAFAESLALEGDCYRAATEYKRVARRTGSQESLAWAHERIGNCYYGAAEWLLAEQAFLSAAMLAPTGEERRWAAFLTAACRFNLGDFESCEAIVTASLQPERATEATLAGAPALAAAPGYADLTAPGAAGGRGTDGARAFGLLGLCSLANGDWSTARDWLARGAQADGSGSRARTLAELSASAGQGGLLPRKSPRLAAALSVVVPGLGQVYTGRTSEGLRHFLFNGALLFSIAKLARDEHYPAAVALAGLEVPFYAGNVIGARDGPASYNRAARMAFVIRAIARTEPAGLIPIPRR